MDIRLTSQDYWLGAALAAAGSLILVVPLVLVYRNDTFKLSALTTSLASALFWGSLATLAIFGFWEIYYQFFYPAWLRWLAPLDALLYALIGLGMWWLAMRLPGPAVLWFVILGGFESIAEHLVGIYLLRILERVPLLQGVAPAPALAFAFFEYIIYWALVAWLAFAFLKFGTWLRA